MFFRHREAEYKNVARLHYEAVMRPKLRREVLEDSGLPRKGGLADIRKTAFVAEGKAGG